MIFDNQWTRHLRSSNKTLWGRSVHTRALSLCRGSQSSSTWPCPLATVMHRFLFLSPPRFSFFSVFHSNPFSHFSSQCTTCAVVLSPVYASHNASRHVFRVYLWSCPTVFVRQGPMKSTAAPCSSRCRAHSQCHTHCFAVCATSQHTYSARLVGGMSSSTWERRLLFADASSRVPWLFANLAKTVGRVCSQRSAGRKKGQTCFI